MIWKHLKTGSYYLRLWVVWESTNDQPRERKWLYFSFGHRTFNVRRTTEFEDGRFKRIL